jgi:hypothetical protein
MVSQTGTLASMLFVWATKYPYNHASIAFDRQLKEMYSFGRRLSYFMLIAGFVDEQPRQRVYARFAKTHCEIYEIAVTDQQYAAARAALWPFLDRRRHYQYDIAGVPFRGLGVRVKRSRHWVCSEFVAHILVTAGIARFEKDPYFIHPNDFRSIPGARLIYQGYLSDYYG